MHTYLLPEKNECIRTVFLIENIRFFCYDVIELYSEWRGIVKISKKFKSLVLVGALLVSLPISVLAGSPEKKVIDYVALGDSLAFGIMPDGKPGVGYPVYLNQRFQQSQYTVDFYNYAEPKFTTVDVLTKVLPDSEKASDIGEAEFITIDIGANDILPLLNSYLTGIPLPAPYNRIATTQDILNAVPVIGGNINTILKEIDRISPNAKVYVMGYYNPIPHIAPEQQPLIEDLLGMFNDAIETAAILNGDTFVPTARIITKDNDTYLPNPANIHLSPEGYQLVAKEFWKNIDKSKSK